MTKKSADEILAELKRKQEVITNRIASVEARKRKDDDRIMTRKKILVGAYILETFKNEEMTEVLNGMDSFLTRPLDRKLFGLPLKTES